ncbi:hypothetical protein ACEWY4_010165 [Coilia grayii]|uniref:Ig-like domain-containing protein n=1 Tax=Coilia grayii TaxID=363190 RepID=A0ABD1K8S4_9TELE
MCLDLCNMRILKPLVFFPLMAAAQLQLEPRGRAALLGSDASFNCSLKDPWVVMTWLLNRNVVLTISMDQVFENDARFTAVNYTTRNTFKWEFTVRNVTRNDSGEITCDVQNIQSVKALLSVQESGSLSIMDGNVTVRHGDQAVFICVALGWFPEPQVFWSIDGIIANSGSYNTTVETNGTKLDSTSTLKVAATDTAQVQCLAKVAAMKAPKMSSVFLIVDETNQDPDRTVLIAVTLAFSLAALLVLVIIGVIFYCKRKRAKKSTYQDNVTSRIQSSEESGKDNPVYIIDGYTSHHNSPRATDSYQIPNSQTTSGQPKDVKILRGTTTAKCRHATIV